MNLNLSTAPAWAEWLLRVSVQAAVLAVLVYLAIGLFQRWISPAWRFALWGMVMLRLMLPVSWESPLSLFNLWPGSAAQTATVRYRDAVIGVATEDEGQAPSETSLNPRPAASEAAPPEPRQHSAGPVSRRDSRLSFWDGVGLIWVGVIIVLAAWHITRIVRFSRRLRAGSRFCGREVEEELHRACVALGISRRVRVVETALVSSASLYGFWRPWILLPVGFTDQWDSNDRRWVFLHELAHLKRWDTLLLWLIQGLCVSHWFNPMVWWVARKMGEARELACDALVLSRVDPASKARYGLTILKLAEKDALAVRAPGMLSHSQKKRNLERRINMIANHRRNRAGLIVAATVLAVLGITGFTDAVTGAAERATEPAAGGLTQPASVKDAVQALETLGAKVEYAGGDTNGTPVSVHLDESGITDDNLAPLTALPSLTNLWLRGFRASVLSDETLSYISGLTNLQALRFYGTVRFTEKGLAQLKNLDRLEVFNLGDSEITDAALGVLAELDSLKSFWMAGMGARFWGDRVTDTGCETVSRLSQLTQLGLLNTGISSAGVFKLGALTNLTFLNLGANPLVTDEAAPAFSHWKKLDTLWLFDIPIGDECLVHIGAMENLELLDLAGTRISDRGLKALANLKKLKNLILGGSHTPNLSLGFTDIGDEGVAALTNLASLKYLTLERTRVTDDGMPYLAQLTSLETVRLGHTRVTGRRFGELHSLTRLSGLDLSGTQVTDEGLAELRHLKRLEGVDLTGTGITDAGLANVRTMESLRGVVLKGSKVTADGVEALRHARTNLFVNWP